MLTRLLYLLDRHRWAMLTVVALGTAASCVFLPRLKVLDSPERWMPQTTRTAWDAVGRHFDIGDNIGIGLLFHRPVTEEDLPRLKDLRRRLMAIEGVSRVYDCSLVAEEIERVPLRVLLNSGEIAQTAPQQIRLFEEALAQRDGLGKGPDSELERRLSETRRALEQARRCALYQGALWDSTRPDDPSRMLMTVCELDYDPEELTENADRLNARRRHVTAEVERIVAEEKSKPGWQGVEFHAASGILMMAEMEKRTRHVAMRFLPLSLAIALFALLLGFRSWRALFVTLLASGMAIILLLGWVGASGGSLGVITMAAPAIIAIIATASTIHFASYAAEQTPSAAGLHRAPTREQLVRAVCVPCLGSAVTTGVGFLMLYFNELAPIRDLAWQMFAGSMLAFLAVFVVSGQLPIHEAHSGNWLTAPRLLRFVELTSLRRPAMAVCACAAFMLLCGYLAWPRPKDHAIGIHVDTDPFSFFSDEQPIRVALRRFAERQFPVFQLDVVLVPKESGKPPNGLLEPADDQYRANLASAQRFTEQMAAHGDLGVVRVLSTLTFRRRYDEFLAELHGTYADRGPLAALAQLGGHSTSANILKSSFRAWNTDKQNVGALRVTIVANDIGDGFEQLMHGVREALPQDRFHAYLTGSVAQGVNLAAGLRTSLIGGLEWSFLVIGLVCFAMFRSLRLTLIAMLPNVFPIMAVFGLMGLFKMPLSSGSAMVATVALGIALNDTIHFILHYRERTREQGHSPQEAIRDCVRHLGRAVVLMSLVHIAGFAIFLCTDFLPLYHFGILASFAMLAALAGDLILLPSLLLVFDRPPKKAARVQGSGFSKQEESAVL
jgi:predicted RND superfamily exporter protein